ncbi:MAG: ATP-binding protein [Verrucomicrobiae bacterium]|nr:ATP-binding protein [Verrucomicrobiae bacterium]
MKHLYHHECHSCPSKMAEIRAKLRESAADCGFDEQTTHHLVLAVDEACTNIIRHAYEGKTDGRIELDLFSDHDFWEVRLRDYGKKCPPEKLRGRPLSEVRPGGLGLHFIRFAFDEVIFDTNQTEGTCLRLRKKISKKK